MVTGRFDNEHLTINFLAQEMHTLDLCLYVLNFSIPINLNYNLALMSFV
jgi:hypothetical protein